MRIVAGTLGGRTIAIPSTRNTRPMTHKVRAALFDMLGPLDGLTVLDAYAGSGALGFEALSRGATHVDAIELAGPALKAIQSNIDSLKVEGLYKVFPMKVESWLEKNESKYDVIFAMPPYALIDREVLTQIGSHLKEDSIMVVEFSRHSPPIELHGLSLLKQKDYGDPILAIYRK